MDAFYASVEQRDDPSLQGKPIAVGGGEKRGVTTTASYEARKFGVRSAMPGWKARQLCPEIIFVPPRFSVYREVSQQIRQVFQDHTDLIEPLSLDEAFLDVTENKKSIPHAMDVARDIMNEVKVKTNLTCSAGVSYCKFLAKVASGMNKPEGLTIIRPQQAASFLEELPVEQFFGVGKVTAARMNKRSIFKGADLKKHTRNELVRWFGKSGSFYYDIVRGIDDRPVRLDRERKSIGVERTLDEDKQGFDQLFPILQVLVQKLSERIQKADTKGRTLTMKFKSSNFETHTRSTSRDHPFNEESVILQLSEDLLREHADAFGSLRLLGLTLSNLDDELDSRQLVLPF